MADLDADTEWRPALNGVDVVVHTAARVHVMHDTAADPLAEFRRVNVNGTLRLARQAIDSGVRRFIFISSIKVNGEETTTGHAYEAGDTPAPVDAYGVSKHEAEVGLRALARDSGMDVTIIRPVLVYGPGVGGNFRTLMAWLRKRVPLPLGAIHNRRSLVALPNLVDLIARCAVDARAANETFLISDGEDLSTTELLRRTARALGTPARLLPVPASLLGAAATVAGRRAWAQRLCGSLQVNITPTRARLEWSPPVSVDEALAATARDFLLSDR